MFRIISRLVNTVLSLLLSGAIAAFGIEQVYHWAQKEALVRAQQGLPSLIKISSQLTGITLDKNMNLVPIKREENTK
jgi:hypothetical protein